MILTLRYERLSRRKWVPHSKTERTICRERGTKSNYLSAAKMRKFSKKFRNK